MASKNFLLTGSSTGIGETTALRLASLGHQVFAGVRKKEDGQALEKKAGKNLTSLILDVTQEKSISDAVSFISDKVKQLNGLVNNAGIVVAGPQEFIPLEAFRQQLDVNVTGPFAMAQAFIPLLRSSKGRIVNVGSLSGLTAVPFVGPYSASKFALRGLTDSLRMELHPFRIHVALVEPGPVATPIWGKSKSLAFSLIKDSQIQVDKYYGKSLNKFNAAMEDTIKTAVATDVVARVIEHALLSSKPKIYYPVGRSAKMQAAMSHLVPQLLMDKVIRMSAGLDF